MPIDQDELNRRFDHHPPSTDDVVDRHEEVRRAGKHFAYVILQLTPPSREQSQALTDVEDAVMHANAAIARNQ